MQHIKLARAAGVRRSLITGLAATFCVFASSPSAAFTGFSLGAFDRYGILINSGVANGDINTSPVNANIGIGNITGTVNLHNEVVNGRVDLTNTAAANLSGGAITGTQPASLGGPAPASVNNNVANVANAITIARNLSSYYGAEAASGTAVTINNASTTFNSSSGFLDTTGTRIFTASTFNIGNSHTVTINGLSTDYVVLDVTGTNGGKLDGALTLTGGLTSDHVLVNFIGSGNLQGAANGATLQGTFLAPNLGINLDSLTINGRVFGGASNTNFQFVSGAKIIQPAIAAVPEPAVWGMMMAGFGLVGVASRRRRPNAVAA